MASCWEAPGTTAGHELQVCISISLRFSLVVLFAPVTTKAGLVVIDRGRLLVTTGP